jgi:hypothetical protein
MSDEIPPTGEQPVRRPSPTSRARRIGGRPTPQSVARPTPGSAAAGTPVAPPPPAVDEPPPVLRKKAAAPPAVEPALVEPTVDEPLPDELATEASGGGVVRWLPAGIVGAAAIALIVLLAIASHGVYWAKSADPAGARAAKQEQVLAAAKQCFATVNTYDYRKLTGLVAKDLACTTGGFKTDLQKALQTTILARAPKLKAVQTAVVSNAGIMSVTPDGKQWTTLIYGHLTQSNSTTAKSAPRTDLFGAVVTMTQVGSRYLISKVDFDDGNGLGG